LIDVIGVVTDGALRVHWTYNPARREPSRIEALAALFLQALQQLIHHCDSVAATRPYAKNVSDWQTLKRWYVAEPMDGCSALIGMAAGGVGRNLFLFHPLGGPVNHYRELANELQRIDSRHGIYALQYPALTRRDLWLETVSDMAAHYLSEMRQVQPRGPYHLAGHSGGTIVALETAQQLRRLKETVGSLILIGIPPISLTMQSRSQRLSRLAWILAPLEASLGAPITFDREALLSLSPGNRARAVLESVAFRAQGVADSEISDLRVIATVALILDQAFAEYTPRPYADSVVMLHEVDDPATRSLERTRGWADYFPDLRVEDIPGDHFSSLRPPHVTRAARAIRQFFTEGADPAPFRNLGAPTQ
jgi:thioesterase domain-containing protein